MSQFGLKYVTRETAKTKRLPSTGQDKVAPWTVYIHHGNTACRVCHADAILLSNWEHFGRMSNSGLASWEKGKLSRDGQRRRAKYSVYALLRTKYW